MFQRSGFESALLCLRISVQYSQGVARERFDLFQRNIRRPMQSMLWLVVLCSLIQGKLYRLFDFKLCCDLDTNVRNGAELLDRLLKDTVTENSGHEKFDIIVLMQLLRERIYVKNSYVRQFLVSWVSLFCCIILQLKDLF